MADTRLHTPEAVNKVLERFAGLDRPARPLTTRQLIIEVLMPDIEAKLADGWRYHDLVAGLRQVGIEIQPNTLRNYVAKARAGRVRNASPVRATKRAAEKAPPSITPPEPPPATSPNRRPKRAFAGFDESP